MFGIRRSLLLSILLGLLVCAQFAAVSANPTVGLLSNQPGSFAGYTLFSPIGYPATYLIDNEGSVVHSWSSGYGWSSYLLDDGSLLRSSFVAANPRFTAGGGAGQVTKFAWDSSITWSFAYSNDQHMSHHDIRQLPNGNVLMIAWEYKTAAEAIAAGRNPALLRDGQLWPDEIIEVQPTGPSTGDIVWEWHVWDHLIQDNDPGAGNYGVVADHPELIDVNYFDSTQPATGAADWLHSNGIDYNPELDQIVLSVRHFSEFWIIDHSTTTAEAAAHTGGTNGKGGDVLYRWGNPQAYRAGEESDQQLFLQHDAEWIKPGLPGAGDITVFNNGNGRPGGDYSSVEEIVPPVDGFGNYELTPGQAYAPATPVWTYAAPNPADFYSSIISGAERLPNGDTLILSGIPGRLFEVAPDGTIVWEYVNPVSASGPLPQGNTPTGNSVFRAYRYAPDYPGLAGKDLTPGAPIEVLDSDGDGLLNLDELKIYGTDLHMADTDGDGLTDGQEVNGVSSPKGPLGTFFPDPLVADTDGDSCSDGREMGGDATQGGLRDPTNQWDYSNPTHDGKNRIDDILLVVNQYFIDSGDPNYNPDTDRTLSGPHEWNLGPPDGLQRIGDILNAVHQYSHDCSL